MTVIDNPDLFMVFVYFMAGFFAVAVLCIFLCAMRKD